MLINFKDLFLPKKINGIIHIGAHELEELSWYLKRNIRRVIWIEANAKKYDLINTKIKNFENMLLGKFAAGSKNTISNLNIANNGLSSSILELGTHLDNYPEVKYDSTIEVEVKKVDDWLDENFINKNLYNFINIDIQGFELEALKGMPRQLEIADYIFLEVNFEEVYKNCPDLKSIDQLLKKFGFARVAMKKTDAGWGDAFYSKNNILISRIYFFILINISQLPNRIGHLLRRIKNSIFRKLGMHSFVN